MNQVAQIVMARSAHNIKHADGYRATRKRPKKSLRKTSDSADNLVVFTTPRSPTSQFQTQHTEPGIPGQKASAASTPIIENRLASPAANHDQRGFNSKVSLPATATTKPGLTQSTHARVFAGLAVIAIGVTWIAMKSATPEPGIQAPAASERVSRNGVAPSTSDQTSSDADMAIPSAEAPYTRTEEDYLDEINWLNEQNHFLEIELDVLSQEALDLNRQLLDLELQLTTLSQPVEPDTEPKVVYESVDVPLGFTLSAESDKSAQKSHEQPDLAKQVLNYDPDTGFYLNAQFNEGSDAPVEDYTDAGVSERPPAPEQNIRYPPIVPTE